MCYPICYNQNTVFKFENSIRKRVSKHVADSLSKQKYINNMSKCSFLFFVFFFLGKGTQRQISKRREAERKSSNCLFEIMKMGKIKC